MDPSSAWLLLAAGLVGFAAAWLAFETRRAWSPESLRSPTAVAPAGPGPEDGPDTAAGAVAETETMPTLVEQVAQLRREITAVRAAEIETALRARTRELQREPSTAIEGERN
jgi:hypothetical protein